MLTTFKYFSYFILSLIFAAASLCQAFQGQKTEEIAEHQTLQDLETQKNLDQILLLIKALTRIYPEADKKKLSCYVLFTPLSLRKCDAIDEMVWQTAIRPLFHDHGGQENG